MCYCFESYKWQCVASVYVCLLSLGFQNIIKKQTKNKKIDKKGLFLFLGLQK